MTAERPARPHRPPDLTPVGDTLADAFRLLRAPPEAPDGPRTPARRVRTGPESAGEDLLKLVLTLVELLRQLIERQALRRVDAGDLTDAQEEELGATLLALHERMTELCAEHGYALEDLNLDLGPLGSLLDP
ncbi:gas vesicle protein K [Streptomyces sp. WAC07061]|uniref:gas vesicle protein K n=1 Tax=Streptomyces sp. WAC07061 TaxID=2487410 RepID=UPI000F7B8523|nr:gas vesicle protein K [Streptomyces sp. WAC07061]RSS62207.1 gas vesicle protein K [Streptomyces sp. WAC07061]